MNKKTRILIMAMAGLFATAQAEVIFNADFESGTAANTGLITYNAGFNVQTAVTTTPDATLGNNVLLADPTSGSAAATEITWTPTSAASLTGGQSAIVSLNMAIRRTNGATKSHYVTGYDSADNMIFQLVLGDLDEFGNASGDRQRPGYADSTGAYTFDGQIELGTVPGSYWFGGDSNHADGFNSREAQFDIAVTSTGWSLYTVKNGGGSVAQTSTLATYDGGTYSELAYVKLTGESSSAGGYFDNLTIQAIPEPASLGLVAMVGGGIFFIRRRFMI